MVLFCIKCLASVSVWIRWTGNYSAYLHLCSFLTLSYMSKCDVTCNSSFYFLWFLFTSSLYFHVILCLISGFHANLTGTGMELTFIQKCETHHKLAIVTFKKQCWEGYSENNASFLRDNHTTQNANVSGFIISFVLILLYLDVLQ